MQDTINTPSLIYLDNAASTPILDEVIQEMIPYLKEQYGNPSSLHKLGFNAMSGIERARKSVSILIGAKPKEIIFTSGGTEADNLAIKGAALHMKEKNKEKNHIIVSSIEHDAVLEVCKDLEARDFKVTYLPVTKEALVEPVTLESAITERTGLISIMLSNNEVGTIQPIHDLAKIAHDKSKDIIFHTDAVQVIGKIPIDVRVLGVDLLSISSHKINGPKGVGALYIRNGITIGPLIHGGGQESFLRAGTENTYGIVGFGKACEIASRTLTKYCSEVLELREYLIDRVLTEVAHSILNGSRDNRNPSNTHFSFLGVKGEDLIIKLNEHGIAASTGSACSMHQHKRSHVLKQMGLTYGQIEGSLRLTLGLQNTREEIDHVISSLSHIVEELRSYSQFKL